MRIGIDIESGERPFQELIRGVFKSIQNNSDIQYIIIGNSKKIKNSFPEIENFKNIEIIHADEIIYMHEKPVYAIHKKKNCTVNIGIKLIKKNLIDVFFSPGNTGATVVSSVLNLGMIDGIKKPAMGTFFPRIGGGETLIIDIGVNPEAKVENLYHNAILGIIYYNLIWEKSNPSVGLLNMGGEFEKGSLLLKKAFTVMSNIPNFIGNVEGYNVFNGSVDIVVCDGFTGNSILKIAEAMKKFFIDTLKNVFSDNKTKSKIRNMMSYSFSLFGFYNEKKKVLTDKILPKYFGAAPVLGIKGLVMVGHGACTAIELINAIEFSKILFKKNYIDEMKNNAKKLLKKD
ncbi:MAG: phosphate acyltransferase PlsX [Spirochaetes bacterium]|nr:phosphate acyltransferase PlsX [Spirochaetota bacterium]